MSNGDEIPAIRLRSREFTPKAGVGGGLTTYLRRWGDQKTVHVIVQAATPLGTTERRRLAREDGVRLLDSLGDNAFYAAVTPEAAAVRSAVGRGKRLRWIGAIEPADKLPAWLRDGDVPEHAVHDDGVGVVVLCFGDVPMGRQRAVLSQHARDLTRIDAINGWHAIVDAGGLEALASEDIVKWVEEEPRPPQVDNDNSRSATGIDADAVLAPSVYGLTGAGVTIAQWETTHASLTHVDFAGRITLGDGPITVTERSIAHTESVAANNRYDDGEAIYIDMDDSLTVSAGDIRVTAVGGFPAASTVAAGDADVGQALVYFRFDTPNVERFVDNVTADGLYTAGEPIYRDVDGSRTVSVGDVRLTPNAGFPAGSTVAAGNADVGQALRSFNTLPHDHSTHVAGTAIGSGAGSAAAGGAANQWKGVAPGASLRSYRSSSSAAAMTPDYTDAVANGATISVNSWGTSHMHETPAGATGYDALTALYDAIISGRQSDGTSSGIGGTVSIIGSAGNEGVPERHAENIAANGQLDGGEAIYVDSNDSGTVDGSEVAVAGPAQAGGTALVTFAFDETHDETAGTGLPAYGTFQGTEGIYRDVDGNRTVSAGDVRISVSGFPAGSVVAAGNADVGRQLRPFRFWQTARIPNSAKNTVEVANLRSDTARPSPTSSRGPTLDGRLKPDVSGPGSQAAGDFGVTSAIPGNAYGVKTGTSMSTPAVAGAAAVLTEAYRATCVAGGPAPHTLRALLVHGAEDRTTIPNVPGSFVGPDFTHGYGRVRLKESVDLVPHHLVGTANAVGDTDVTITIGAMAALKVTLAWDDPPWMPGAAPSPVTGMLQNDLDLLLIAPDGTQHTPWVLNPANPAASATRSAVAAGSPIPAAARDRRNTVEQVVVDNAVAGTWTIRVTASTLNVAPQPYTIVCEMLPPQAGACTAGAPAGDVWMQDNASDTGTVPSTGTMWQSQDVWNRLVADGSTTHDNPEFGQTNFLYARLRNATAQLVHHTSVDAWIAPASTGLAWPASFRYVGRFAVPKLAANEVRQIGPLPWLPPDPDPSSHFCLYVRAASAQDSITFAEVANVDTNTRNSNNIIWRNVNVVNAVTMSTVSFLVANVDAIGGRGDVVENELVITVPEEFMKQALVEVRFAAPIERAMGAKLSKIPGLGLPDPMRDPVAHEWAEAEALHVGPVAGRAEPLALGPARARRGRASAAEAAVVAAAGAAVGPAVRAGLGELALARPPLRPLLAPEVRIPGIPLRRGERHPVSLRFTSQHRRAREFEVSVVQRVRGKEVGGILYIVRTGKKD